MFASELQKGAITRSLPRLNTLNTLSNLSIRSQRLTEDHMIIIIIMIIVSTQQVGPNKAQTSAQQKTLGDGILVTVVNFKIIRVSFFWGLVF